MPFSTAVLINRYLQIVGTVRDQTSLIYMPLQHNLDSKLLCQTKSTKNSSIKINCLVLPYHSLFSRRFSLYSISVSARLMMTGPSLSCCIPLRNGQSCLFSCVFRQFWEMGITAIKAKTAPFLVVLYLAMVGGQSR